MFVELSARRRLRRHAGVSTGVGRITTLSRDPASTNAWNVVSRASAHRGGDRDTAAVKGGNYGPTRSEPGVGWHAASCWRIGSLDLHGARRLTVRHDFPHFPFSLGEDLHATGNSKAIVR